MDNELILTLSRGVNGRGKSVLNTTEKIINISYNLYLSKLALVAGHAPGHAGIFFSAIMECKNNTNKF